MTHRGKVREMLMDLTLGKNKNELMNVRGEMGGRDAVCHSDI